MYADKSVFKQPFYNPEMAHRSRGGYQCNPLGLVLSGDRAKFICKHSKSTIYWRRDSITQTSSSTLFVPDKIDLSSLSWKLAFSATPSTGDIRKTASSVKTSATPNGAYHTCTKFTLSLICVILLHREKLPHNIRNGHGGKSR